MVNDTGRWSELETDLATATFIITEYKNFLTKNQKLAAAGL